MATRIARHRHSAYASQSGRCYYCGFLMWEKDVSAFARTHNITCSRAQAFRCTAEHLQAKKDGGTNAVQNIVAACFCCNSRRHRRKRPRALLPIDSSCNTAYVEAGGIVHCHRRLSDTLCMAWAVFAFHKVMTMDLHMQGPKKVVMASQISLS